MIQSGSLVRLETIRLICCKRDRSEAEKAISCLVVRENLKSYLMHYVSSASSNLLWCSECTKGNFYDCFWRVLRLLIHPRKINICVWNQLTKALFFLHSFRVFFRLALLSSPHQHRSIVFCFPNLCFHTRSASLLDPGASETQNRFIRKSVCMRPITFLVLRLHGFAFLLSISFVNNNSLRLCFHHFKARIFFSSLSLSFSWGSFFGFLSTHNRAI